jgi:hypothetical protein
MLNGIGADGAAFLQQGPEGFAMHRKFLRASGWRGLLRAPDIAANLLPNGTITIKGP